MQQFSLEEWLKNKSRKVVTRSGVEAEIIHDKYPLVAIINGVAYNFDNDGKFQSNRAKHPYDLFFADEKNTNKILDELKSYFEKTPKEQVDKDWKEIQDWYAQHFTNEKHNDEEELTEFEKELEMMMVSFSNGNLGSDVRKEMPKQKLHNCAHRLLELAKKDAMEYDKLFPQEEFISKKQYDEDIDKAYKNADIVQFNRGMTAVLNNPHRYFHVGDTIRLKNSNAEHTITSIFNGKYYGEGWSLDIIKAADDYELVENCNEISDEIDYSSEIIGFLENYIKAYGCTGMKSWVKWIKNQLINKCGKA